MRTIVITGFTAGLLAAALPAQATDTSSNANRSDATRDQPQANGTARERQICILDPRSETRIRRTICHTAREWRDLEGEVPTGH